MQNRIEIGSWKYQSSKVSLFLSNNKKIKAKIFDEQGNLESSIPAYDMNLPKDLVKNHSVISLSAYLQNTYVHIKVREDDSVGLYINPRMHGGGWGDGIFSAVTIAGGVALTVCTGGLGTVVGAGLIGAGVNGFCHAVKTEENFNNDYIKKVAGGAASGIILGMVQITKGPLVSNTATVVSSLGSKLVNTLPGNVGVVLTNFGGKIPNIATSNITIAIGNGIFCGLGGAASQAISSNIIDGKVDIAKVMFGAVLGCALSVNNQPWMADAIMKGIDHFVVPMIKHQYQAEINKERQKTNSYQNETDGLKDQLEQLIKKVSGLTKDANQLREDLEAQIRENERLQKQKDAKTRNDPTFFGQTHRKTNTNDMPSPLRPTNI